MQPHKQAMVLVIGAMIPLGIAQGAWTATSAPQSEMPSVIEQFSANRMSLQQTYQVAISPVYIDRMQKFYQDELTLLKGMNFDQLSHEDQVDYQLLKLKCDSELHQLTLEKRQYAQMQPLLPFAAAVEQFMTQKRLMQRPDAEKSAAMLALMVTQVEAKKKELEPSRAGAPKFDRLVVNRAVLATQGLQKNLKDWYGQYNGYDPVFTWWVNLPYQNADKALTDYVGFLKDKLIGIKPDDKTTIIGDPVGADALKRELADNMIPYTPEN